MAYKVYEKLTEEGTWIAIMDVKRSRVKKYDRIFMTEDEAKTFIKTSMKTTKPEFIKIEEIEV